MVMLCGCGCHLKSVPNTIRSTCGQNFGVEVPANTFKSVAKYEYVVYRRAAMRPGGTLLDGAHGKVRRAFVCVCLCACVPCSPDLLAYFLVRVVKVRSIKFHDDVGAGFDEVVGRGGRLTPVVVTSKRRGRKVSRGGLGCRLVAVVCTSQFPIVHVLGSFTHSLGSLTRFTNTPTCARHSPDSGVVLAAVPHRARPGTRDGNAACAGARGQPGAAPQLPGRGRPGGSDVRAPPERPPSVDVHSRAATPLAATPFASVCSAASPRRWRE